MKYIIDIPKTVGMLEAVGSVHYTYFDGIQCNTIILKSDEIEELNSDYINEHFGQLQDEAYQRGLKDGKKQAKAQAELDVCHDIEKVAHGNYQKGLDDAWEAARKIALMDTETSENVTGYFGLFRIMENLTPMQAIEKLKAYEESQKADSEIKVGDEVEPFYTDITGMVTLIDGDTIYVLWRDGSSTSTLKLKEVRKTGRHFNIASILEEMKNEP